MPQKYKYKRIILFAYFKKLEKKTGEYFSHLLDKSTNSRTAKEKLMYQDNAGAPKGALVIHPPY